LLAHIVYCISLVAKPQIIAKILQTAKVIYPGVKVWPGPVEGCATVVRTALPQGLACLLRRFFQLIQNGRVFQG